MDTKIVVPVLLIVAALCLIWAFTVKADGIVEDWSKSVVSPLPTPGYALSPIDPVAYYLNQDHTVNHVDQSVAMPELQPTATPAPQVASQCGIRHNRVGLSHLK